MKIAALLALVLAAGMGVCRAANPSYANFNTNQFTNLSYNLSLKDGVILTNPFIVGMANLTNIIFRDQHPGEYLIPNPTLHINFGGATGTGNNAITAPIIGRTNFATDNISTLAQGTNFQKLTRYQQGIFMTNEFPSTTLSAVYLGYGTTSTAAIHQAYMRLSLAQGAVWNQIVGFHVCEHTNMQGSNVAHIAFRPSETDINMEFYANGFGNNPYGSVTFSTGPLYGTTNLVWGWGVNDDGTVWVDVNGSRQSTNFPNMAGRTFGTNVIVQFNESFTNSDGRNFIHGVSASSDQYGVLTNTSIRGRISTNLWSVSTNIVSTNLTVTEVGGSGTLSFNGFTNLGGTNFLIIRSNTTRILVQGWAVP